MSAASPSTPLLRLRGAGYRYPSAPGPSLRDVNLDLWPGERVLLTGPTGCGKSTLLRLASGLLGRHGQGQITGTVHIEDRAPEAIPPRERVTALGFVSQEPSDQLVAGTIGDELAFGMESAGWPPPRIDAAIPELLRAAGLELDLRRDPRTLSGGQTQRLVTAAALAAGGRLLVLDEPLAQLDPMGARTLLATLADIAARGVAVLMVEHRLGAALPWASRCVLMEAGTVIAGIDPCQLVPGSLPLSELRRLGLTLPGVLDLADRLGVDPGSVGTVLQRTAARAESPLQPDPGPLQEPAAPALVQLTGLRHRWPRAREPALRDIEVTVRAGERIALVGGNGAGKSTLLAALAGTLPGLSPSTYRKGHAASVVAVPQDPDLALFCPTVAAELAYGPREQRQPPSDIDAVVHRIAAGLSLDGLLHRAPQAASRGQRLRIAVGAALCCRPGVLLLDEPTSGQDHDQVERMFDALHAVLGAAALVFATHDLGLALRRASRAIVLDRGRIVADGPPGTVLAGLAADSPLELPPLARLCLDAGVPFDGPAAIAARVRASPGVVR